MKAIVLGAGKGTRMKTDLAKVLYPVAGRPMLLWVLEAVAAAAVDETVVVVGHQADAVRDILPDGVTAALQAEQLGTGHATVVGLAALETDPDDEIIVMPGDMPLVTGATLRSLLDTHRSAAAAATLLTVELDEPSAYGRVIREDGAVSAVVEAKDATPQQLAVSEVNTSVYVFTAEYLPQALEEIDTDNAQGEYYLTDVVGILVGSGHTVAGHVCDPEEGLGINSVDQVGGVERVLLQR
ncbi:MAG: NTP transferase domain-containing protein [Acidimicrobiia bacterium]|nr:NTP transferase domain-containing protein [Acidimicrobiia bacterium]